MLTRASARRISVSLLFAHIQYRRHPILNLTNDHHLVEPLRLVLKPATGLFACAICRRGHRKGCCNKCSRNMPLSGASRFSRTSTKLLWSWRTQQYASCISPRIHLLIIAQEAGKLLLHPDTIVFNGNTLQIVAEATATLARPMAPPSATTGLFVPRAAQSRPRAGLGSKQRGLRSSTAMMPSTTGASGSGGQSSGGAKGQDDFRKMLEGSN